MAARRRCCARPVLAASLLLLVGVGLSPTADAASISYLQPKNGPPTGGFQLTVIGVDLALEDLSFGVRVGGTSCESTKWVSKTQLTCRVAAGFFPSNVVTATVRFNTGSGRVEVDSVMEPCPCYQFTFDQPASDALKPERGSTTGDQTITFLGKNFAGFDVTPRARVGATAAENTRWVSDTCLFGRNTPSVLPDQSSVITAYGRKETRLSQFTYDRPMVDYVFLTNSRTAGEGTMTVVGSGFGTVDLTQRIKLGDTGCLATNWVADSTVLCKLPADTNSNLGVTVSISQRYDLKDKAMSFDDPLVTAITPTNLPLMKPRRVSIFGFNFGGQQHNPRAGRFGDTSCLEVAWYSDTAVSCLSQPGYARDLFVTMTIANIENDRKLLSYDAPLITALFRSNGPASGSSEFTVYGESFGGFELTPVVRVGSTGCMRTGWISESSVICKAPRVPYDKWFLGKNDPVSLIIGSSSNQMDRAYTYDMACVGPCVIGLACSSSTGGFGCNGPTHGDYRHSINADQVEKKKFDKEHVLRIIGNFTLRRENNNVLVGNTTNNKTIQVSEQIYNDDISVTFGDMYDCTPLPVPKSEAQSTVQQYLDCVMPVGVGHGHSIKVTIRNATYKALLDSCTDDMKKEDVLPDNPWQGIWPPKKTGEVITKDRIWGNCLLPTSVDEEFDVADDIGVSFSYNAPTVIKLTPNFGMNSKTGTANVTLTGTNFGGEARRIWGDTCRNSQLRACRLLFENAVAFFNTSCLNIDLLLAPSTGGAMEQEAIKTKLAYCKSAESYMIKCKDPFAPKNLQCETMCPPGLLKEDDLEGLCRTFCSEDTLVCQPEAIGGEQQVSVVVGDQTSGETQTFSYKRPEVYSVFPPELAAGTSSLLTVMGQNFGVDMPEAYAGRMYLPGEDGGKTIALPYNPYIVPFNASSIDWWDDAQYSACFSTQTEADERRRPVAVNTPSSSASSFDIQTRQSGEKPKTTVYDRKCDQGRAQASQITISKGTFLGQPADRMVIQSPVVNLVSGQAVVSVDVILQSLGLRSLIDPENATLRFRASCGELEAVIAEYTTQWYQGVGRAEFTERSSFLPISYGNKVWLLGGESKAQPVMDEIWTSTYGGVTTYTRVPSTFPWWGPRFNTTAVVHKDILFILGGEGRTPEGAQMCLNDVWVYADVQAIADYYTTESTPVPELAKRETYQPFWIEITKDLKPSGAPWPGRRNAYAVSFRSRVWLIGGIKCSDGSYFSDLWSSADMRTWRQDKAVAMWRGRNNIMAAAYNGALYVVASVQSQFYNTFYTTDGVNYFVRENSCALTHVDVIAMVAYSGYLMVFTIGCHNQLDFNQVAVPCSHPYAGPLENRIYMTTTGQSWYLTVRTFSVDFFEKAVHQPYLWSSRIEGELRYNFKPFVHLDTLFLVGGVQNMAPLDAFGKHFPDENGNPYIVSQRMNDIWLSKALLPSRAICMDRFDDGLTGQQRKDKLTATWKEVNCNIYWNLNRVRWRSKIEIDVERGYVRRSQQPASQPGAEDEGWDTVKWAQFTSATRSAQTALEHIQSRLAALKPTLKALVGHQPRLTPRTSSSAPPSSSRSTATSTSSPSTHSSATSSSLSSVSTPAITPTSSSAHAPPSATRSTSPTLSSSESALPSSPPALHAYASTRSPSSYPTATSRPLSETLASRSLAPSSPALSAPPSSWPSSPRIARLSQASLSPPTTPAQNAARAQERGREGEGGGEEAQGMGSALPAEAVSSEEVELVEELERLRQLVSGVSSDLDASDSEAPHGHPRHP